MCALCSHYEKKNVSTHYTTRGNGLTPPFFISDCSDDFDYDWRERNISAFSLFLQKFCNRVMVLPGRRYRFYNVWSYSESNNIQTRGERGFSLIALPCLFIWHRLNYSRYLALLLPVIFKTDLFEYIIIIMYTLYEIYFINPRS